jgi:hypothetical protein
LHPLFAHRSPFAVIATGLFVLRQHFGQLGSSFSVLQSFP